MIKSIITTVSICICCCAANAQFDGKTPGEYKADAKALKLTKEQAAQMDALKAEWKQETDAIKADKSLSKVEKKVKINELKETYRPRRDAIYTPKQREIMEDYDTGIFGTKNMKRNKRWNERALEKEAKETEKNVKNREKQKEPHRNYASRSTKNIEKNESAKEKARPEIRKPGDRRRIKEEKSGYSDETTTKEDKRLHHPPRHRKHKNADGEE